MKPTLLFLALALAQTSAAGLAAEPVATARPAPAASAATRAAPAAAAVPVDNAKARADLADMREQMRELSRKMADLSAQLGDSGPRSYAWRYLGDSERAMLGIVMRPDDKGVQIDAVTPGGPAEIAGVRPGDVVTAIDGVKIPAMVKGVGEANHALSSLKVDQSVRLALLRDGKTIDLNVKAARREAWNWPRMVEREIMQAHADGDSRGDDEKVIVRRPDVRRTREVRIGDGELAEHLLVDRQQIERQVERAMRNIRVSMPWWGMNLVSLNADLAGYFGTSDGVLVLSVDAQTAPELKSGDVVQSIDGNKVDSPEDAMRRLRDARVGSELKLQVLRQKKPLTLSMKAPEFKNLFPLPPAPPTPPTAPVPPAPASPPAALPPPAVPVPPVAPVAPVPPPDELRVTG